MDGDNFSHDRSHMNDIGNRSDKLYVFSCKCDVPNIVSKSSGNVDASWVVGIYKGMGSNKIIEKTIGFVIVSGRNEFDPESFIKNFDIELDSIKQIGISDDVISRVVNWAVNNDGCMINYSDINNVYNDVIGDYLRYIHDKKSGKNVPNRLNRANYIDIVGRHPSILEEGTDKYLIAAVYYINNIDPESMRIELEDVKFPELPVGDLEKLPVLKPFTSDPPDASVELLKVSIKKFNDLVSIVVKDDEIELPLKDIMTKLLIKKEDKDVELLLGDELSFEASKIELSFEGNKVELTSKNED